MEEQVRQAVARGWCDPRNSHKEMDVDLADAISAEVVKSFSPIPTERLPFDFSKAEHESEHREPRA